MTERKMTDKGFLHKASGKAANSAKAFLAAHREYLLTGTLGILTEPILVKLDKGQILPTPALGEIRNVVMSHMIAAEIAKGQAKIERAAEPAKPKNYTATIYTEAGEIATRINAEGETVNMVQGFEDYIRAQDWCDRRLALDSGNGWTAKVVDNRDQREVEVDRDDAFARFYKRPKSASMKVKGVGDGKWRMRAKGDHFNFSRG
jgi:hypothetical protein